MKCPSCETYNPDDRMNCWRCGKELPKPEQKKKRNPQKSAQTWLYVGVALFLLFTLLQTCGVKLPFGPQTPEPTGYLPSGDVTGNLVYWAVVGDDLCVGRPATHLLGEGVGLSGALG